jgi:hypothetical protein
MYSDACALIVPAGYTAIHVLQLNKQVEEKNLAQVECCVRKGSGVNRGSSRNGRKATINKKQQRE